MTIAVHHGTSRPMCRVSNADWIIPPGNDDARPRLWSVGSTADDVAVTASMTVSTESSGAFNVRSSSLKTAHYTFQFSPNISKLNRYVKQVPSSDLPTAQGKHCIAVFTPCCSPRVTEFPSFLVRRMVSKLRGIKCFAFCLYFPIQNA